MTTNHQAPGGARPQAVKAIDIRDTDERRRLVKFDGDGWIAEAIRQQGMGSVFQNPRTGLYTLRVSGRFEFEDVVGWLRRMDPDARERPDADDEDDSVLPEEDQKFDA